jgi:hypothetical protein
VRAAWSARREPARSEHARVAVGGGEQIARAADDVGSASKPWGRNVSMVDVRRTDPGRRAVRA